MYLMKTTTNPKVIAQLDSMIAHATKELDTWRRNGIPVGQKELEVGRLVLRRAELARR